MDITDKVKAQDMQPAAATRREMAYRMLEFHYDAFYRDRDFFSFVQIIFKTIKVGCKLFWSAHRLVK